MSLFCISCYGIRQQIRERIIVCEDDKQSLQFYNQTEYKSKFKREFQFQLISGTNIGNNLLAITKVKPNRSS